MNSFIPTIHAADIPLGSEVGGVGPFQIGISGGVQAGLGTLLSNLITTITVVGGLAFLSIFRLAHSSGLLPVVTKQKFPGPKLK